MNEIMKELINEYINVKSELILLEFILKIWFRSRERMNKEMNEWIKKLMNEWMNERNNEWMN